MDEMYTMRRPWKGSPYTFYAITLERLRRDLDNRLKFNMKYGWHGICYYPDCRHGNSRRTPADDNAGIVFGHGRTTHGGCNMHGKKVGIALAALATLALTASLALARPGGGPGSGPGAGGCPGYGQGGMVQLTPEKQAVFQKLHDAFAAKTAQLRATLGVKMAELNALAVAPTPDQAKIEALAKEIGELKGKLLVERTQFRIQVDKEVGPGVMGGWGGHRGMRGGMGGCGGMGCQ
jgi:zinc resistance-associated protein